MAMPFSSSASQIEVPLGALAEEVVAFAGGLSETPDRLLMGGPMMGLHLPSLAVPVIKGSSGLLALTAAEVATRAAGACIRCGSCMKACPVGLLPLEMNARVVAGQLDAAVALGLKDCIACGCCAYVCPSHLPLVQAFAHAKGELAARERATLKQEATKKLAAARVERAWSVHVARSAGDRRARLDEWPLRRRGDRHHGVLGQIRNEGSLRHRRRAKQREGGQD